MWCRAPMQYGRYRVAAESMVSKKTELRPLHLLNCGQSHSTHYCEVFTFGSVGRLQAGWVQVSLAQNFGRRCSEMGVHSQVLQCVLENWHKWDVVRFANRTRTFREYFGEAGEGSPE